MKTLQLIGSFLLGTLLLLDCSQVIEGELVIQNVSVIDVETGEVTAAQDVGISGDSISAIQPRRSNNRYAASRIVDGSDYFLIPGLWDMHTHTWWGYQDFFPLLIANGVTGIRELFGDLAAVSSIREEIDQGAILGPKIISAGPVVDGNPPAWEGSDIAETPEQGQAIVRKQQEAGADFIKVYSLLTREAYFAIADECKKRAIPFGGHIPRTVKLEEAITAGQQFIEHFDSILEFTSDQREHYYAVLRGEVEDSILTGPGGFTRRQQFLAETFDKERVDDLIRLLSNSNTWLDPTSVANRAYAYLNDPEFTQDDRTYYMPEYAIRDWSPEQNRLLNTRTDQDYEAERLWYRRGLSLMKPLLDGGVKFLVGTDYPNAYCYPGFSLHDELQLFVEEAGFTPLEALQTATLNPAIFLEIEDQSGSVAVGMDANLLLLQANPLEDINHTRQIEGVILRGRYYAGDSLRAEIEKIAHKNRLPKIHEELKPIVVDQGVETAIARYHELKETQPSAYNFDEEQLNRLGYELLEMNRAADAVMIFELNVDIYPDYANGFDSLGDGYLAAGEQEKAQKAWEKAVAMGQLTSKTKLETAP